MKKKVINIYEFSELQPAAQHKAIQDYTNRGGFDHLSSEAIETIQKITESLEIDMFRYFVDIYNNHNTVHIQHAYSQAMHGPRLATWLNSHFPSIVKDLEYCKFSGVYLDANFAKPIKAFLERPTTGTTLTDLIRQCIGAVLTAVHEEYKYQSEPENFGELADINNWYFLENGEITTD